MDLNADQQKVIAETQGARSVVAGPGSGKTTTMVAMIRNLLLSGVSPADIRAVTFSKEMATVLEKRIKVNGVASTFHSLGYLICSETERKPVEPELRHRLMCKLCRKWKLDYKELDHFIARMREAAISPAQATDRGEFGYGMTSAYAEYEQERHAAGWMDFSSMLADAVALLEKPEVRQRWSPKFLIVDEAQDTSDVQWRMMQLMAEKHGNITVVGDSNQCIYGFRGAKPDNITNFQQWFPNGRKFYLGKNYRCHPPGVLIERCAVSGNRKRIGVQEQTPIEVFKPGYRSVTWDQRSWRFRLRGRHTDPTVYIYDGDLITITTAKKQLPLTPNHDIYVRFNQNAVGKYVVYLMWKKDFGYRIGHSRLATQQKGKLVRRLWHRIHKQRPNKLWILRVETTKHASYIWEQMISARYAVLQTPFIPEEYTRGGLTAVETQAVFNSQTACRAEQCLLDYSLLQEKPLLSMSGNGKTHLLGGFHKTAVANAIVAIMDVPTREGQSETIIALPRTKYQGPVYSLSVAEEHNYIANGIVVGNSTQNIVKFVRENAPGDTPQELLDRMVASRAEVGVPIDFKMYWSEEQEAESALALANKDPLQSIILARTNRMVGLLERICNKHNVLYHLMGKTGFWKQNEIRKAIDLLKNYPTLETAAAMSLALPGLVAKYAVDDRTERDNDAIENLGVLRVIGKDFRLASDFTAYANKMQHRRNDPKGVSISTCHQAKGGEWRNVYVIGASAKGFPHPKGDPREERRIWFVAISRATDVLRISFSGTPSPYLRRYLPDSILDQLREKAEEVTKLQAQHNLFA